MAQPFVLTDLPAEIISLICEELCLHCRGHRRAELIVGVPEKVALDAREDKRALARLSRTCKALNAISQPVVFHYFHSGNQPWMKSWQNWDTSRGDRDAEDDLVLPFIRSLIERPDLAMEVRALSLYYSACRRQWGDELVARIFQAAQSIGMNTQDLRLYPQALAIALSRNVEQLLVGLSQWDDPDSLAPFPGELRSLEYIAAVATGDEEMWISEFHFRCLQSLLARAPNLKVLEAADCGGNASDPYHREDWDSSRWPLPLKSLRKLTVNNLSPWYLANVLDHCPVLEELEVWTSDSEDHSLTNEHLDPVRDTIRRLCYSVAIRDATPQNGDRKRRPIM